MMVSLTVPLAVSCAYGLCLILTNWIWSVRVRRMERLIVGQDHIIENQRETIEELHELAFARAVTGDDDFVPASWRIH